MIGVILWSSAARHQAVIWCDDHAALAYLSGIDDVPAGCRWPAPGEMVELDCEVNGEVRLARRVRPLPAPSCEKLPSLLNAAEAMRSRPAVLPVSRPAVGGAAHFGAPVRARAQRALAAAV